MSTTSIQTGVLSVDKITKGSIRYAEPDDVELPVLTNVYVPKHIVHALGGPEQVRITIEAV